MCRSCAGLSFHESVFAQRVENLCVPVSRTTAFNTTFKRMTECIDWIDGGFTRKAGQDIDITGHRASTLWRHVFSFSSIAALDSDIYTLHSLSIYIYGERSSKTCALYIEKSMLYIYIRARRDYREQIGALWRQHKHVAHSLYRTRPTPLHAQALYCAEIKFTTVSFDRKSIQYQIRLHSTSFSSWAHTFSLFHF